MLKYREGFWLFTSKTQNILCVAHCVICVLGAIPEKAQQGCGGCRGYTFLKKPLEFFTFLLYPWKLQIKQSSVPRYFTELC